MKLNENRVLRLAGLITENEYAKLQEMEFATQNAFDNYKKQHDLRPDTKVTVAGKLRLQVQLQKTLNNRMLHLFLVTMEITQGVTEMFLIK